MSSVRKITAGISAVAVIAGMSACGGSSGSDASESIRLGAHLPMTGALADGGKQMKSGAEAYFNYINENGGINGRKIEFIARNDDFDPQKAVTVARELVEQKKVVGMVSSVGTATGLAVLPYLTGKKIPYVATLSGDPRLLGMDASAPVFGVAPTGDMMGAALGTYGVEGLEGKRVASFYQNDAYGVDGRDGFKEAAEEAGAEYVGDAPYELSTANYSSQIKKLRSAKPDVVVLYAVGVTAANFLKQVDQQGWDDVKFVAPSPMCDPSMVSLAGDALDGLTCSFFTAINGDVSPEIKEKEDILHESFPDVNGGYWSFQGMAGAEIAVSALESIKGEITPERFTKALEKVSIDPVITPAIAYSADDHAGVSEFGFAEWNDGVLRVVQNY